MTVPFLSARRRPRASSDDRSGRTGAAIEPLAMVCSLDLALSLADQKLHGFLVLPEPTAAMIVVTRIEDSPVSTHHRDLLWQAFGLPVFEQLRGADGAVIARECEVHDGLHVADKAALPERAQVLPGSCDCGDDSIRFRAVPPLRRQAVA